MSNDYWQQRIQNIKNHVNLRNLIDHFNVDCQSDGIITQVHCPFHGHDNHASARIYETNTMYCWVCSQKWDVISFVKDFKNITFSEACKWLEDFYGLEKVDVSVAYHEPTFQDYLDDQKKDKDTKTKDFDKEFTSINNLLLRNKSQLNLEQYSRYFYYLDSLFSSYKLNKYSGDLSLQLSLDNLRDEIAKLT